MSTLPLRNLVTRGAMSALVTVASEGAAQQVARVVSPSAAPIAVRAAAVIVAPALLVATTPPAHETVEVQRPAELPGGGPATFVVTPTSGMRLLGRMSGTLSAPGDSSGSESVLLTVAVPASAPAGIVEVARVRFLVPGGTPVDVPIRVAVAGTAALELVVPDGPQRAVPGGRLLLQYAVVNAGNTAADVTVRAVAPGGWTVRGHEETVTLRVNQVVERGVEVAVPLRASTGSATVLLIASVSGAPVANAAVRVEVMAQSTSASSGPVLTMGATLGDSPGGATTAWSATLEGRVTPGIRVSGRASGPANVIRAGNAALFRLGAYAQPASLSLDAGSWTVALGHSGFRFSELTGSHVAGSGVQSTIRNDRWTLGSLWARPSWGGHASRHGSFVGATSRFDAGPLVLSASGSRLEEGGFEARALDALGFSAEVPSFRRGSLSTEVAYRRYAGGSGAGFGFHFDRRTPDDNVNIRVLHAPGGRTAFAQARNQVHASLGRRIGDRVAVYADHWASRDEALSGLTSLRTEGTSATARIGLTREFAAGIGIRQSRLDAIGNAGGIRSGDTGLETTLDFSDARLFARIRSSVGQAHRSTFVPDAPAVIESGGRVSLDGSAGVRAAGGTVSLIGRYDRTEASVLSNQGEVAVRAERIPVITRGTWRLQAQGEVRRTFLAGFGSVGHSASAGLEASLPFGLTISWAADRNPYFRTHAGASEWTQAIRVERRTVLPALAHAATRGVVFRDLNGNGRRDAGETGIAGAVVRQDGATAVSGPDGVFSLRGAGRGGVALDPLSLDAGWIVGPGTAGPGRRELAAVPVAPVMIVMRVEDPQGIGITTDTLRPVAVLARHESGRMWVARRSGAGTATFDALPPGRYVVQLDLSGVAASLVVAGELPGFDVTPGIRTEPIAIVLAPRALRIRQLRPPSEPPPGARP